MYQLINTLAEQDRQEYLRREAALFKSRVGLYCLVTTALYFAVSIQYLLRKTVFLKDTFRPWELSLWVILIFGTFVCYDINKASLSRSRSKVAALLYTGFFIWSFSGLAVVYPENISVFVFYYAFALLVTSSLIPWRISEVLWLTAFYTLGFLAAFDYVIFVMKYPSGSLPRFHQPFDGLVFIGISCCTSVLIRRKEIEKDVRNFILLKKIEAKNNQIDRELELARRVHKTLVADSVSHKNADIWVTYIPMSYVSGDYAKYRFLDEDKLLIFISDVTGHGVAAALLVNRIHSEFERLIQDKPSPEVLLKKLNDFIAKDFEGTNMYLSAFCGLMDFSKKELAYSSYGHPTQYLYQAKSNKMIYLGSQNTLLGITVGGEKGQVRLKFEAGDRLLMFTDGVVEALNSHGQIYGDSRLIDFISKNHDLPGKIFNEKLVDELTQFRGGSFADDIYVLNVKTKMI